MEFYTSRKRRREAKNSISAHDRAVAATKTAVERMRGAGVERLARYALEAMRGDDAAASRAALSLLREALGEDRLSDSGVALANATMLLALAGCADVALFASLARSVEDRAASLSAAQKAEARIALGVADVDALTAFASLGSAGSRPRLWTSESLVRLWQYSKTVPKTMRAAAAGERDDQWPPRFADPNLPLLVDIGCGFGASTLTFAATQPGFNVIGCDRARHALAYAKSVAARSRSKEKLGERCAFVVADGLEVCRWIRELYPGEVRWVLLQFPTPYALQATEGEDGRAIASASSGGGGGGGGGGKRKTATIGKNAQLPPSAKSGRFMCNDRLLKVVLDIAAPGGTIVFSTNVEDVGVTVRESIARLGKKRVALVVEEATAAEAAAATSEAAASEAAAAEADAPLRVQRWVALGGARARGRGWLQHSVLPSPVRTETEAYYEAEGKPIHRFAFTKR
jgi:SAM-dependent methyltransferase